MKALGLYIHIPFCRSKCLYCDFCSFPRPREETLCAYADALRRDLEKWADRCADYEVDTVYFGGGTPTLLPADLLAGLLETVKRCYRVRDDAEITVECNPKTGGFAHFSRLREAGFNRMSIGLQSAHADELRALGRVHSLEDFSRTFADARAAGFDNISVDVMSGIPRQSVTSYLATLEKVCDHHPEHISSYTLTVEENTPFGRMGDRLVLPDEDVEEDQYYLGIETLYARGYRRYEISNFSRAGYESRHNLKYWSLEEYLGFGPAAHSDFGGRRFGNSRDLDAYVRGEDITEVSSRPSRDERIAEYVMLRMRLSEGVRLADFQARFGVDFDEYFAGGLRYADDPTLVYRADGCIRFSSVGMRVSNSILSEWLDFTKE